jgi:N-acetylmuramoyl-L-alanine amidase
MRTCLALCLLLLSSVALAAKQDAAEGAYQEARTAYYALKGDAAKRKLRHHWINVAQRFEAVAAQYPKSARAPDALFTAGELMNELSRISFLSEDLHVAIADYEKLVEAHPRHRLTDDAALALARIHLERLDQPEAARRVITGILAVNGKGDRARELKELLASLPAPKPAPARKAPAPAVAEAAPPQPQPQRPGAALVEAISRVARESAPTPLEEVVVTAPAGSAGAPPVAPSLKPRAEPPAPVAAKSAPEPAAAPAKAAGGAAATSIVTLVPTRQEPPVVAAASAKPAAGAIDHPVKQAPPAITTASVKSGAEPQPSIPALDKHVAETRLKAAAKNTRQAELTLVEQLGLKIRRVVIDPGHGGHDTGAIGKAGTREKDITLAISLKLAAELRERGLEVILTREDDRYLKLEDRAQLANEARGDLFISVHCNSATNRKLRGVETYTLNLSSDRYSIRLAARENATSERGISDLQFILADLATKANTGESTRLATQVQKSLVSHLSQGYSGIKDLGTKEALFYVLLGVKMPAILVETSFLSHAEEEERLASEKYQEAVARAIAQGVEDFLGDRHRLAKVD